MKKQVFFKGKGASFLSIAIYFSAGDNIVVEKISGKIFFCKNTIVLKKSMEGTWS